MFKRVVAAFSTIAFALLILSVSILRSARVYYAFTGEVRASYQTPAVLGEMAKYNIDYNLPYAGKIMPGSSIWFLKAGRDKLWLGLTTNSSRRAELNLLFANKRLVLAKTLFEQNKADIAFSTLSKAEKYLESASAGVNSLDFAEELAKASLKHREMLEVIMALAPEDAKPKVMELTRYPEAAYKTARDFLRSKGKDAPESPFDWD